MAGSDLDQLGLLVGAVGHGRGAAGMEVGNPDGRAERSGGWPGMAQSAALLPNLGMESKRALV